jgi:hypothetical protein
MAEVIHALRADSVRADSKRADSKRTTDSKRTQRDQHTIDSMVAYLTDSKRHPSRWIGNSVGVPKRLIGVRARLVTAMAAAALALLVGAAYAGKLPGPAQNAVSVVLSKVGLSVPGHAGTTDGSDDESGDAGPQGAVGPDASGAAHDGLCNAYLSGKGGSRGGKSASVAFQNVQEAADAAGQTVEEFCGVQDETSGATPGEEGGHEGKGKDQKEAHENSGGSGEHGKGKGGSEEQGADGNESDSEGGDQSKKNGNEGHGDSGPEPGGESSPSPEPTPEQSGEPSSDG